MKWILLLNVTSSCALSFESCPAFLKMSWHKRSFGIVSVGGRWVSSLLPDFRSFARTQSLNFNEPIFPYWYRKS